MATNGNNMERSNINGANDLGGTANDAAQAVKDEVSQQAQQVGADAKDAAGLVADSAKDVASTAKDAAGIVVDSAKDAAASVAQIVREQAGQVKSQASVAVVTGAAQAKDSLAGTLEKAAEAVNQKAQDLPRPEWAQPVSGTLRSSANYLRERDVNTLADDFVSLVRQRPLQMLVGAFVFGYMLGKALRGDNGSDIWGD